MKNLRLAGIYWVAERSENNGGQLLPRVSQEVHRHGWKFFWIPYWNASGAASWKSLGFDAAYQQPNYYFSSTVPYSRLSQALNFGRSNGMGMEMEWDEDVANVPATYGPRMDAYMDTFGSSGFYAQGAQAHYQGSGGLIVVSKSANSATLARYNRYCQIVYQRQIQAALQDPFNSSWIMY